MLVIEYQVCPFAVWLVGLHAVLRWAVCQHSHSLHDAGPTCCNG